AARPGNILATLQPERRRQIAEPVQSLGPQQVPERRNRQPWPPTRCGEPEERASRVLVVGVGVSEQREVGVAEDRRRSAGRKALEIERRRRAADRPEQLLA